MVRLTSIKVSSVSIVLTIKINNNYLNYYFFTVYQPTYCTSKVPGPDFQPDNTAMEVHVWVHS